MGSSQGPRPEWEKPEIVELDAAEDAAGLTQCTLGSGNAVRCANGQAAGATCSVGSQTL